MKELLLEVLGWLGYLERPTVLLQLAVVIGLILLRRQASLRRWLPSGWAGMGSTCCKARCSGASVQSQRASAPAAC
jgi:hypothetical protein